MQSGADRAALHGFSSVINSLNERIGDLALIDALWKIAGLNSVSRYSVGSNGWTPHGFAEIGFDEVGNQ